MEIVLIILVVVLAIWISSKIADAAGKKGRSQPPFFWLSLLLFPLGAIIAGFIIAGAKTLSSAEKRALNKEQFESLKPHLPKILGGPNDNRLNYRVEQSLGAGEITPDQAQNQLEWQDNVFRKMIELGAVTQAEIQKAMSGHLAVAGRIDQQFQKLKRKSLEFADYVADLDSEFDTKISTGGVPDSAETERTPKIQTPPELNVTSHTDVSEALSRLAELRASGALSEEEFTLAKERLLGDSREI